MSTQGTTLHRHLWQQQRQYSNISPELSAVLMQLAFATKILASEISRAALVGHLGLVGEKNATGDAQKKLDVFSNQVVMDAFVETGLVTAIASEELDQVKYLDCGSRAPYILCIDPLDGSSNTDINGSLGTIFGIYSRISDSYCGTEQDVLRRGSELVAAGYVLYGTSTLLVYTCGEGVHGFTLDPSLGEFLLSHPDIRTPERGHLYSANLSHASEWPPQVQAFIGSLTYPATDQPYSLRYTGALVADLHRSLLEGGLYFYPPDRQHPEGKLRLLYECAPLAFVMEQAGGQASSGKERILEIQPQAIHQRSPLVIGSAAEVALYERFLNSDDFCDC